MDYDDLHIELSTSRFIVLCGESAIRDHPFETSANCHDFLPQPPYNRHFSKMLMKGIFDPYVLWPFEHWHMRTSSPLRHADVLNGWSLIIFLFYRFNLHLHWTTTIFILNLALADFLYCVVNLPLYALQYLHQRWIWGPNLCYYTAGDSRTIVRITSTC